MCITWVAGYKITLGINKRLTKSHMSGHAVPPKNVFASSLPLQKILTWFADSSRLSLQQQVAPPVVCVRQNREIAGWRIFPAVVQTQCAAVPLCSLALLPCGVNATLNFAWEVSPGLAWHRHPHVQSWDNTLSHVCHAISDCSRTCDCPRVQVRLCFLLQKKSKSVISLH